MNPDPQEREGTASDVQGISRLVIDAVTGVGALVEDMHRTIAGGAPGQDTPRAGGAEGLPGFVYRRIRGIARAVGSGQDAALAKLVPLLGGKGRLSSRHEAAVGVLNGVLGDYLEATNNPLACSMKMRFQGRPLVIEKEELATAVQAPGERLLILVHGLCMNGGSWNREGHDHGASLARDLGFMPLYLEYNSGRHISTNGRECADMLEQLIRAWPVPVREVMLLCHSMGGLVSRSACHYAEGAGHHWRTLLKTGVFLGTPHLGAPLERAGHWAELLMGVSPYTAPLSRVSRIRSAGIQDLRHGSILDEDWGEQDGARPSRPLGRVPLPEGVACWLIAGTRRPQPAHPDDGLPGDGLVSVHSALGRHEDPAYALVIPEAQRITCHGLNHLDLLGSPEVYDRIRRGVEHGRMT